jgi:hypothetical protein
LFAIIDEAVVSAGESRIIQTSGRAGTNVIDTVVMIV